MKKLVCVLALAAAGEFCQSGQAAELRVGAYRVVSVKPFTIAPGIAFPEQYLQKLMIDVTEQLTSKGHFAAVLADGEATSDAGPVVQLSGVVTEFKKGSRAMRYFVGMGTGKTVVKARIAFQDGASGKTLLERDVDGLVWIGFAGGDSNGATRGLAKEVAKVAASVL